MVPSVSVGYMGEVLNLPNVCRWLSAGVDNGDESVYCTLGEITASGLLQLNAAVKNHRTVRITRNSLKCFVKF